MLRSFGNILWFTNVAMPQVDPLTFTKSYNIQKYPEYENYQGIEVKRIKDIPKDYNGIMGVPITFLTCYNPDQFELLGLSENLDLYGLKTKRYTDKDCQQAYYEIYGKEGRYDLNATPILNGRGVYKRLFIKHKHPEV